MNAEMTRKYKLVETSQGRKAKTEAKLLQPVFAPLLGNRRPLGLFSNLKPIVKNN